MKTAASMPLQAKLDANFSVLETIAQITEIAAASHLQADAIVNINMGVDQISNAIQQSAATIEQSVSASQDLLAMVRQLQELIGHYRPAAGWLETAECGSYYPMLM